ncbi:MAG: hypothetical protein CMG34_01035 [Candidatus Marinimicrobia bacterium]|nr:hypothetical protein [Candidatus Neomarinimicrobiota bacterium]
MNRWIKLFIGFSLSFIGLYFSFKNINFGDLKKSFESIDLLWVLAATLLLVFYTLIRSFRWRLLLFSIKNLNIEDLFASNMIGYFGNSILPFKMGEVLRGYSISNSNNLKTSTVLGSIVLERVCDLFGLIFVFILVSVFYSFPNDIELSLIFTIIFIVAIILLLLLISFKKKLILDKISNLWLMNSKSVIAFIKTLRSFSKGFNSLYDFRSFFFISLHTIITWIILFFVTHFALLSLDMSLSWVEIGVVLLLTSMAMSVPAAPGSIGTHHFATFYVMNSLFNYNSIESQTFAIVLHAISYLPLVIIGSYYFFKSSIQIFDVFDKELVDEKV